MLKYILLVAITYVNKRELINLIFRVITKTALVFDFLVRIIGP